MPCAAGELCAVQDLTATHVVGDVVGGFTARVVTWSKKEKANSTASALHALPRGSPLSVPRELARTLYFVFIFTCGTVQ